MSEELKACPFCGSDDVGFSEASCASCENCGADGPVVSWKSYDGKGAGELWNARPDGWISVDETLPDDGDEVVVFNGYAQYIVTKSGESWSDPHCFMIDDVTHWQPLPEPPK